MILVIFFPAARLIEPFRSAKPLFLPFPGRRTEYLCAPSACHSILPHQRGCSPAVMHTASLLDGGTACLAGDRSHTMLTGLSAGCGGAGLSRCHTVRVRGVLLLRQPLWGEWSGHPVSQHHPPAQSPAMATMGSSSLLRRTRTSPCAPFPSGEEPSKLHRAAVMMQGTPHTAPGARCSPGPTFPRLGRSSLTQHLGRAARNHHLIQVHLARHHRGGGGFHPTRCWTAGFLYHLQRQHPATAQNGPEDQGYFPWCIVLVSYCKSWAEPWGERSWRLPCSGHEPSLPGGLRTPRPLRSCSPFCRFCQRFGKSQR